MPQVLLQAAQLVEEEVNHMIHQPSAGMKGVKAAGPVAAPHGPLLS